MYWGNPYFQASEGKPSVVAKLAIFITRFSHSCKSVRHSFLNLCYICRFKFLILFYIQYNYMNFLYCDSRNDFISIYNLS